MTGVQKDTDDSFDATATSNGATVRYEITADYATVTVDNHRSRGGGPRPPLSSDELSKVTAAVKAKDAVVSRRAGPKPAWTIPASPGSPQS